MVEINLPCLVASEIRAALDEGRRKHALKIAIEHGNRGYHSEEFSKVVAELLALSEPQPGMEGRPQNKYPSYWYEIGTRMEELMADQCDPDGIIIVPKLSYEKAIERLEGEEIAEKTFTRNTIAKAYSFYKKARAEHDSIE